MPMSCLCFIPETNERISMDLCEGACITSFEANLILVRADEI
jgi:hypothetical protein